ncbi:MAG: cellulose binding domain-containing protein, partial [Puniceicoccales bacterium]
MKYTSYLGSLRYFILVCAFFGFGLTGSAARATFEVVSDWGSGFTGSVTVTNDGAEPIEDWELSFEFDQSIGSVWNAEKVSQEGNLWTFRNASWNGRLSPGQSASFGFTGSPGNVGTDVPTSFIFSGEDPGSSDDIADEDPVSGGSDSVNGEDEEVTDPTVPDDSGEEDPVDENPVEDVPDENPVEDAGSATVDFDVTSSWYNGYTAYVRLTNDGATAIDGWTIQFDLGDSIVDFWGATGGAQSGNTYVFSNESWNGSILPGETVSFGIQAAGDAQMLSGIVLNEGIIDGAEPDDEVADGGDESPTEDDGADDGSTGSSGTTDPVDEDDPGEVDLGPITNGKRVVAYFPSWGIYSKGYQVEDIPAENLTHIIHAFATISASGEIAIIDTWADVEIPMGDDTWSTPIRGNFGAYARLKDVNPDLRVLIAVG